MIIIDDKRLDSDGIRFITINRPHRRNALDGPSARALAAAILESQTNLSIRVIVLTGSGEDAFCGGADLADIQVDGFEELLSALAKSSVPVIAAVNGAAVGGGFGIVLASDIVVMSQDARIGTPEVSRGLLAMFILHFAYRVMPEKVVNEMILVGETIDAQRAFELHVANHIATASEVLPMAFRIAEKIGKHSGPVIRLGKETIFRQRQMGYFDEAMKYLGNQLKINLNIVDTQEGIRAFFEKRKPVWKK